MYTAQNAADWCLLMMMEASGAIAAAGSYADEAVGHDVEYDEYVVVAE